MGNDNCLDRHHVVADRVARELTSRTTVQAVLLAGSLARNEHLITSDIDLLVVDSVTDEPLRRTMVDGVLVETITHTGSGWIARFQRPTSSWLYAFLDARVLYEVDRTGQWMKQEAEQSRRTYTAPAELRRQLATMLWHGQAKLARAAREDEQTQGFWAAICVDTVLDGLYTIHNVPVPAGSRRMAYLDSVPLLAEERQLLRQYLTGTTAERFRALTQLTAYLRKRLGPAEHESAD